MSDNTENKQTTRNNSNVCYYHCGDCLLHRKLQSPAVDGRER